MLDAKRTVDGRLLTTWHTALPDDDDENMALDRSAVSCEG